MMDIAHLVDLVLEIGVWKIILGICILFIVVSFLIGTWMDMEQEISEWRFRRWLKKEDRFLNYKTWSDAREGYRRSLEEKAYERETRHWRKKPPLKQRIKLWRQKCLNAYANASDWTDKKWEAMQNLWLRIRGLIRTWKARKAK